MAIGLVCMLPRFISFVASIGLVAVFWMAVFCTSLTAQAPATLSPPEDAERLFAGHWKINEPAGDTCYLYVKPRGRASQFWSGEGLGHIEQGRWEIQGHRLLVRWETGYQDLYEIPNQGVILRKSFLPGAALDGAPSQEARGERLDPRMIGSLTTEPSIERAAPPPPAQATVPMRNPFVGYWEVEQPGGLMGLGGKKHFYLNLQRNGTVTSMQRSWPEPEQSGQTGTWTLEGNEARLVWPSGHRDLIRPDGADRFQFLAYGPKDSLSDRSGATHPARHVPATEALGLFKAAETALVTIEDFVGYWREDSAKGEARPHLEIERWGNAYRFADPSRPAETRSTGQWKLVNNSAVILWKDGSQEVIDTTGSGFVQSSFAPEAPLTGAPVQRKNVRKITRSEIAEAEAFALARQRAEAETLRQRELENRQRAEAESRRKAEDEAKTLAAEEQRQRELAELKRREAEAAEQRRLAEAEARQRAEAESRRLAEEESRQQALAEAAAADRARAEAEARRLVEEETRQQALAAAAAAESARQQARAEAEAKRRAEEEARQQALAVASIKADQTARPEPSSERGPIASPLRPGQPVPPPAETQAREAAERARQQSLAEAESKRRAEAESRRLAAAEASQKAMAEAAAAEQRQRELAEAASRQRAEAEAEARRRVEEETRQKALAEEQSRQRLLAQEEARRAAEIQQAHQAEAARLRAEELAAAAKVQETNTARVAAEEKARPPQFLGLQPTAASSPGMRDLIWKLVFEDKFNATTLDSELWSTGYPYQTISNKELSGYSADNVRLKDGALIITSRDREIEYGGRRQPYSSGVITSFGKFEQTYGYFEIRVKITEGKGLWPSFWLYSKDNSAIRVFDAFGNEPDRIYHTVVTPDPNGPAAQRGSSHKGFDLSWDYHVIGVQWSPDSLVFHVDGEETARVTDHIPDRPMALVVSMAVGGEIVGPPDGWTPFPAFYYIDWLRVFRLAE